MEKKTKHQYFSIFQACKHLILCCMALGQVLAKAQIPTRLLKLSCDKSIQVRLFGLMAYQLLVGI